MGEGAIEGLGGPVGGGEVGPPRPVGGAAPGVLVGGGAPPTRGEEPTGGGVAS